MIDHGICFSERLWFSDRLHSVLPEFGTTLHVWDKVVSTGWLVPEHSMIRLAWHTKCVAIRVSSSLAPFKRNVTLLE